jgi:hypothetical protein
MLRTHGSDTSWVRFDTGDTCFLCLADDFGCDRLMQVKRHEIVDIWFNCKQSVAVLEALLDCGDGRNQIGLPSS